ncbi:hypothetical protein DOY81_008396 [Sarcophaga bullata]|nr:hypothetical protein DOY81_008396 [Sarcophaga bullata]
MTGRQRICVEINSVTNTVQQHSSLVLNNLTASTTIVRMLHHIFYGFVLAPGLLTACPEIVFILLLQCSLHEDILRPILLVGVVFMIGSNILSNVIALSAICPDYVAEVAKEVEF